MEEWRENGVYGGGGGSGSDDGGRKGGVVMIMEVAVVELYLCTFIL